jgi:hypothetical protein
LSKQRSHVEILSNDLFHEVGQKFLIMDNEWAAAQHMIEKRHRGIVENSDIDWKGSKTGKALSQVKAYIVS